MIETGYKSDKGLTRDHNEDAFVVVPEQNVFVVADGVGGANAGEVASSTAVSDLKEMLSSAPITECPDDQLGDYMKKCIDFINDDVFDKSAASVERNGMATTLVICHVRGTRAYTVNVGDSRAYLKRGGQLYQLTEDHTYVQSLVKLGVITRDEARVHTKGHYITRAMGAEENVEADYYQTELEDGDVIILCTDGLYNEVSEERINQMINTAAGMQDLADRLVDEANLSGGMDNITVVCMKYEGGSDEQ